MSTAEGADAIAQILFDNQFGEPQFSPGLTALRNAYGFVVMGGSRIRLFGDDGGGEEVGIAKVGEVTDGVAAHGMAIYQQALRFGLRLYVVEIRQIALVAEVMDGEEVVRAES